MLRNYAKREANLPSKPRALVSLGSRRQIIQPSGDGLARPTSLRLDERENHAKVAFMMKFPAQRWYSNDSTDHSVRYCVSPAPMRSAPSRSTSDSTPLRSSRRAMFGRSPSFDSDKSPISVISFDLLENRPSSVETSPKSTLSSSERSALIEKLSRRNSVEHLSDMCPPSPTIRLVKRKRIQSDITVSPRQFDHHGPRKDDLGQSVGCRQRDYKSQRPSSRGDAVKKNDDINRETSQVYDNERSKKRNGGKRGLQDDRCSRKLNEFAENLSKSSRKYGNESKGDKECNSTNERISNEEKSRRHRLSSKEKLEKRRRKEERSRLREEKERRRKAKEERRRKESGQRKNQETMQKVDETKKRRKESKSYERLSKTTGVADKGLLSERERDSSSSPIKRNSREEEKKHLLWSVQGTTHFVVKGRSKSKNRYREANKDILIDIKSETSSPAPKKKKEHRLGDNSDDQGLSSAHPVPATSSKSRQSQNHSRELCDVNKHKKYDPTTSKSSGSHYDETYQKGRHRKSNGGSTSNFKLDDDSKASTVRESPRTGYTKSMEKGRKVKPAKGKDRKNISIQRICRDKDQEDRLITSTTRYTKSTNVMRSSEPADKEVSRTSKRLSVKERIAMLGFK